MALHARLTLLEVADPFLETVEPSIILPGVIYEAAIQTPQRQPLRELLPALLKHLSHQLPNELVRRISVGHSVLMVQHPHVPAQ